MRDICSATRRCFEVVRSVPAPWASHATSANQRPENQSSQPGHCDHDGLVQLEPPQRAQTDQPDGGWNVKDGALTQDDH